MKLIIVVITEPDAWQLMSCEFLIPDANHEPVLDSEDVQILQLIVSLFSYKMMFAVTKTVSIHL